MKHDLPSELRSRFTVVLLKSSLRSPSDVIVVVVNAVEMVSLSFPAVGIGVVMNDGVALSVVVVSVVVVSVVVVFDGMVMCDEVVAGDCGIVNGIHPSD